MYAAESGAAGVRMYAYDTQAKQLERSTAPRGTGDLLMGVNPLTVGTDRWAAMSAAFNLLQQLEPYLLRPQMNVLYLGPQFVTTARRGPTSTLFMATNSSEAPVTITDDLSPYLLAPTVRATLFRLADSVTTTTDITSSIGTLGHTTVTFKPGETVAWVFSSR